jgi:hypothetical protein
MPVVRKISPPAKKNLAREMPTNNRRSCLPVLKFCFSQVLSESSQGRQAADDDRLGQIDR